MSVMRWFYQGGRPNWAARILNRASAVLYALGVAPNYLVTLEVPGRQSGRLISLPLVMVVVAGNRYLVSMLGEEVGWVRNVRAAGGAVTLRHGRREAVRTSPSRKIAREVADRVVFLDGGVVVEEEPPGVCLEQPRDERTRHFLERFLTNDLTPRASRGPA